MNIMQDFIEKFKGLDKKNGFYEFTLFSDGVGFSIKKDLHDADKENTSILKFFIANQFIQGEKKLKPIFITASYGKKTEGGVSMRSINKISEPVDLTSRDEYYYNIEDGKLYKGIKEIFPVDLLNEIYNLHIKPIKPIKGAWFRMKAFFWRIFMRECFRFLSNIFCTLMYIISGDVYSYQPELNEEVLNNVIVSHTFKEMVGQKKDEKKPAKEHLKESAKVDLLGYRASRWAIVFYSIIHLGLYIIFQHDNWRPLIITTLLKNNFITVIYVIVSLWFMEVVIPEILKFFIKNSSIISVKALYKNFKI